MYQAENLTRPADPDGDDAGELTRSALRACVADATRAPSIHNSQPWRFRIQGTAVDVSADRGRRLEVLDPSGRELLISVGAALFNLRLAIAAHSWVPDVELFPHGGERDLVARVTPGRRAAPSPDAVALAAAIPRRHTNRQPFASAAVPAAVLTELVDAARAEGATLEIAGAVTRDAILSLAHTAERTLRGQGVYRAELAEWTRPVPGRRDGVPPHAFGPWDALEALPLRDFGLTMPRLRRPAERFEPYPILAVLSTRADDLTRRVQAGQALQRVLLAATVRGLATTPMSQPLEIPALRELVTNTSAGQWAQVILRLGYAPPTPATPRRPVAEILTEAP